MAKIINPIAAKADYNEKNDHFSNKAKPCACGSTQLELIETQPTRVNDQQQPIYPARTAVRCTKCQTQGLDTCHGEKHAIRRWNWYDRS